MNRGVLGWKRSGHSPQARPAFKPGVWDEWGIDECRITWVERCKIRLTWGLKIPNAFTHEMEAEQTLDGESIAERDGDCPKAKLTPCRRFARPTTTLFNDRTLKP